MGTGRVVHGGDCTAIGLEDLNHVFLFLFRKAHEADFRAMERFQLVVALESRAKQKLTLITSVLLHHASLTSKYLLELQISPG